MPDVLVAVVIVVAIVAIIRGDAPLRDVVRLGTKVAIVSAAGYALLYLPTWLFEAVTNRVAPTWLTVTSALAALTLAFGTHVYLTTIRSTRPAPPVEKQGDG